MPTSGFRVRERGLVLREREWGLVLREREWGLVLRVRVRVRVRERSLVLRERGEWGWRLGPRTFGARLGPLLSAGGPPAPTPPGPEVMGRD